MCGKLSKVYHREIQILGASGCIRLSTGTTPVGTQPPCALLSKLSMGENPHTSLVTRRQTAISSLEEQLLERG